MTTSRLCCRAPWRRTLTVLLSLSASVWCCAGGQTNPAPVQLLAADLTMPLDVSRAKVGTHVQARVVTQWSNAGCELRPGSLIEGHVTQVQHRTKADKRSEIGLAFDSAECNRQKGTPLKMTVIALAGPGGNGGRDVADVPVSSYGQGTASPVVAVSASGLRSAEGMAQVNQNTPSWTQTLPKQWRPGMVVGLPNMNLAVGTGVDGASVVWAMNVDARLEGQTMLIIIPGK